MNPIEQSMNLYESSEENTQVIRRLFIYGILRIGFWNHDRFCRGVLDIQQAMARSRLYEMPSGIPVLQVPDEDILAYGTEDSLADRATQALLSGHVASYPEPAPKSATAGAWVPLCGKLLTLHDPKTRLPAIDRLEGFRPGSPSLYRRVLVPVCIEHVMVLPVWLYVGTDSTLTRSTLTGHSSW